MADGRPIGGMTAETPNFNEQFDQLSWPAKARILYLGYAELKGDKPTDLSKLITDWLLDVAGGMHTIVDLSAEDAQIIDAIEMLIRMLKRDNMAIVLPRSRQIDTIEEVAIMNFPNELLNDLDADLLRRVFERLNIVVSDEYHVSIANIRDFPAEIQNMPSVANFLADVLDRVERGHLGIQTMQQLKAAAIRDFRFLGPI